MRNKDAFPYLQCNIGDDVWLGHNSVLTAGARNIGRGAIVAAGAVVTRDVAPYAIVAGAPATTIRLRFSEAVIGGIEESRWWEWDLAELKRRAAESPDLVYAPERFFAAG